MAFVAAERREVEGILGRLERIEKLDWPLVFASRARMNGKTVLFVANGPGPKLAGQAADVAKQHEELSGLVSTGFCGALNAAFEPCDIFVADGILSLSRERKEAQCSAVVTKLPYKTGKLLSIDRVASTAAEKSQLRMTGADAVEMEAMAVAERAIESNIPFYAIRVVTDAANESFPMDFNRMRDSEGRFNRAKILGAAIRRSGTVLPELVKLNQRCKRASNALGDFVASCSF